MKGYYKIPFRQVYCQGIRMWIASMVRIFIVYKLEPPTVPAFSAAELAAGRHLQTPDSIA